MERLKKLVLETGCIILNCILMAVLIVIFNFVLANGFGFSREKLAVLNSCLNVVLFLVLIFQNVFYPSWFYRLTKYRVVALGKTPKLSILINNIITYSILIGCTVIGVNCKTPYTQVMFLTLFFINYFPCLLKNMGETMANHLCKIEVFSCEELCI